MISLLLKYKNMCKDIKNSIERKNNGIYYFVNGDVCMKIKVEPFNDNKSPL